MSTTAQQFLATIEAAQKAGLTAADNAAKGTRGGYLTSANKSISELEIIGTAAAGLATLLNPPTPTPTPTPPTPTPPTPTPPVTSVLSGVYTAAADLAGQEAFGTWRGKSINVASDYLGHTGDMSALDSPDYWLTPYKGIPLMLGVPMAGTSSDTFAQGAAGNFDSHYKNLAARLQALAPNAILRLGWEMTGNWYPWSITPTGANTPANFVAYWQHIVPIIRAIAPGVKYCWNPNNGTGGAYTPESAFPGAAYVDYIGVDAYDNNNFANTLSLQGRGLTFWAAYAKQQGVALAVPEWGQGNSVDDPAYVDGMVPWFKANGVLLESLYDYEDNFRKVTPKMAAEYKKLYAQEAS